MIQVSSIDGVICGNMTIVPIITRITVYRLGMDSAYRTVIPAITGYVPGTYPRIPVTEGRAVTSDRVKCNQVAHTLLSLFLGFRSVAISLVPYVDRYVCTLR